jgi:hypothetical protein
MKINHSKPVFATLLAAFAFGSASLAGAAESGLSHNERAAQQAIVGTSSNSIGGEARDTRVATLTQNENAAQRAIVVDYGAASAPTATGGEAVALAVNERAAQRAIVDGPNTGRPSANAGATGPVAYR